MLTSSFLSEGSLSEWFSWEAGWLVDAINNKQTKTVGEMAISKLVFSQAPLYYTPGSTPMVNFTLDWVGSMAKIYDL